MSNLAAEVDVWASNLNFDDREIDDMMVFMASGENHPEGASLMATLLHDDIPLTSDTMPTPGAPPAALTAAAAARPSPTSSQDSATAALPPPPLKLEGIPALLAAPSGGCEADDARSSINTSASDAHTAFSDVLALRSATGTPAAATVPPALAADARAPSGLVLAMPPGGLPFPAWPPGLPLIGGGAASGGDASDDGRGCGGKAGNGVSHSTIEKQRRDRLNSLIEELGELVPPTEGKYAKAGCTLRRPKHIILGDAITTIKRLQEHLQLLTQHHMAYAAAAGAPPAAAIAEFAAAPAPCVPSHGSGRKRSRRESEAASIASVTMRA